jgi:hypothetical protein
MVTDKGPLPTDGGQDERTWIRCSHCKQLRKCYRGPEQASTKDDVGNIWRHFEWLCVSCFAVTVAEAIREPD